MRELLGSAELPFSVVSPGDFRAGGLQRLFILGSAPYRETNAGPRFIILSSLRDSSAFVAKSSAWLVCRGVFAGNAADGTNTMVS